jgi:tripartite-type tricarboxylate transporter receptor subunit TctC
MARVNIVRVPYKGQGAAVLGLLGGEVQVGFASSGSVAGHIRAGKLRALAVTSAKPSAVAPGLPTVADAGLAGYESTGYAGMFAPVGTPARLIALLNREIVRVLNRAQTKDAQLKDGTEVVGGSPRELAATIKAEMARMDKVIKATGIRTE